MKTKTSLILIYLIVTSLLVYGQPSFVIDTILLPNQVIKKISTGMSNDIWVIEDSTNRGVYRIDENLNTYDHSSLMQGQTSSPFTDILNFDTDEALIGTEDDFLFFYQNGGVTKLDSSYGLGYNSIHSIIGTNTLFFDTSAHVTAGDSGFYSQDGLNYMGINSSVDSLLYYEIDECKINQNIGSYIMYKGYFNTTEYLTFVTSSTVYSLNLSPYTLSGINTATFYKLPASSFKYYIGTDNGLSIIYNSAQTDLLPGQKVSKVIKYNDFDTYTHYVLAGTDSGLYMAQEYDWTFGKIDFAGYDFEVYDIAKNGLCFWLATDIGAIRIKDTNCTNLSVDFEFSDTTLGLQDSCGIDFKASCSQCFDSLLWNFGDSQLSAMNNPVHTYAQSGNYTVTLEVFSGSCYDSMSKNLSIIQCCDSSYYPSIDLGPDTAPCFSDSITLSVAGQGGQILWSTGQTDSIIEIINTGTYWVQITNGNGCIGSDTVNIEVLQLPLSIGSDKTLCPNEELILDAGPGHSTYLWSDLSSSQFLTVDTSGVYYVEITDSNNCTNADSIIIGEYPVIIINLGTDTSICEEYILTPGLGFSSYLWSDNSSNPTLLASSTGKYWVEVMDGNNCPEADTINIIRHATPSVNLGADTLACEIDSLKLSVGPFSSYLWSDGSISSEVKVNSSGTYWVKVTDTNTCTNSDTVEVIVYEQPLIELGQDTNICNNNSLLLSAFFTGASYIWKDGSIEETYLMEATETVWVTVTNGLCSAMDTISVQFNPIPLQVSPTYIELCSDSSGFISAANTGSTYLWSTGETKMEVSIEEVGNYSVLITNTFDCTLEIVFEMAVCNMELHVPNTITPNGDGSNDTWEIERIEDFTGNSVQIYNRNGSLVYETFNYDNLWDGQWKNKLLPASTYYYVLDLNNGTEVMKGTLTIIRE